MRAIADATFARDAKTAGYRLAKMLEIQVREGRAPALRLLPVHRDQCRCIFIWQETDN